MAYRENKGQQDQQPEAQRNPNQNPEPMRYGQGSADKDRKPDEGFNQSEGRVDKRNIETENNDDAEELDE